MLYYAKDADYWSKTECVPFTIQNCNKGDYYGYERCTQCAEGYAINMTINAKNVKMKNVLLAIVLVDYVLHVKMDWSLIFHKEVTLMAIVMKDLILETIKIKVNYHLVL